MPRACGLHVRGGRDAVVSALAVATALGPWRDELAVIKTGPQHISERTLARTGLMHRSKKSLYSTRRARAERDRRRDTRRRAHRQEWPPCFGWFVAAGGVRSSRWI
jgi:hypothetical protein